MDVELAIDASEVEVDRLRAQEELAATSLFVAPAATALATLISCGLSSSGSATRRRSDRARRAQLGIGLPDPGLRAELVEDLQRRPQPFTPLDPTPGRCRREPYASSVRAASNGASARS